MNHKTAAKTAALKKLGKDVKDMKITLERMKVSAEKIEKAVKVVGKKCKDDKVPMGKKGRCVKPKEAKKCKDDKVPMGKNGRCVKPKEAKKYKDGKVPMGKNGRCVKAKKNTMQRLFAL